MKDKVLYLIIGILIGAMIATGIFMVINKNDNQNNFNRGNFRNFDFNNLPEGFDSNSIPQGGAGGQRRYNNQNSTVDSSQTNNI